MEDLFKKLFESDNEVDSLLEWAAKQTEFSDNFELPDLLDYNYFDPFGYNNDEQTTTVLDKLLTLQNKFHLFSTFFPTFFWQLRLQKSSKVKLDFHL